MNNIFVSLEQLLDQLLPRETIELYFYENKKNNGLPRYTFKIVDYDLGVLFEADGESRADVIASICEKAKNNGLVNCYQRIDLARKYDPALAETIALIAEIRAAAQVTKVC